MAREQLPPNTHSRWQLASVCLRMDSEGCDGPNALNDYDPALGGTPKGEMDRRKLVAESESAGWV